MARVSHPRLGSPATDNDRASASKDGDRARSSGEAAVTVFRLCCCFFFVAGLPHVAGAQSLPRQSADALLKRVDDHYNRLSSMQTHYTERYSGMGTTRTESGMLLLKKPGRMRWQYSKPAGKLFVFDGKYAWFYTPGDRQVQRIPARQMDALQTPLRFLLGHTELEKELQNIAVMQDGSLLRITGAPKVSGRIRQIALEVSPLGEIQSMSVTEPDGSETAFTFAGTEENVPAKEADFRFTPPAGVTVVDGPPPL